MTSPYAVRDRLHASPFQPFRIHLLDGSYHDIVRLGTAYVMRTAVRVGVNPDAAGIVERFVTCPLEQVSHLEPLPEPVAG
jgi:hypothetical protein